VDGVTDDATRLDGGSTEPAEVTDGVAIDPAIGAVGATETDGGSSLDAGDTSLLRLIDRLGSLLDRSDLSELAVESGATRIVLRKPAAVAPVAAVATVEAAVPASSAGAGASGSATAGPAAEAPGKPSVKAPLTGVWYASPAPGSAPFVAVGREVAVGQVIGLIEAMKLFNEIKSDLAGRVARVIPESGALVKAKQPLIEVDPL
jgi:acetyl-CoA carboxylase biotin carboxyl carrier protein